MNIFVILVLVMFYYS